MDDFGALEPDYLRYTFMPEAHGLTSVELAAAFMRCSPMVRGYVFDNIPMSLRGRIQVSEPVASQLSEQAFYSAQLRVVGAYFWEIVYRRYAAVYEQFSRSQDFDLAKMYPVVGFKGGSVLDIGCGTGKVIEHLVSGAAAIYGVDPSAPLLAIAREKFGATSKVRLSVGSFSQIPLPDCSMDVIVSHLAFQESEERGGVRGLQSMERVLRPGGQIRLVVGNAAARRFLRCQGFHESFVPGAGVWTLPSRQESSNLLEMLYTMAGVNVSEKNRFAAASDTNLPPYVAASRGLHWRRRLRSALAWLAGASYDNVFRGDAFFTPVGIPVYWRAKSSRNSC